MLFAVVLPLSSLSAVADGLRSRFRRGGRALLLRRADAAQVHGVVGLEDLVRRLVRGVILGQHLLVAEQLLHARLACGPGVDLGRVVPVTVEILLGRGHRRHPGFEGLTLLGREGRLTVAENAVHPVPGVRIEGDVRLKGEDIFAREMELTDLRRRVGMVFQKANPFPMSIYDNITYGPKLHGVRNKAELDELVESSLRGAALWDEVKDRLKKSALGLSGGQQQRLCIARALAVKPEVLLMDEPTSALDPGSTMKVEELMNELKKNYTVVIVTHNMQQAARISDRTAFFLLGELVEVGPTNQIFSTPRDKRTEDYISGRFG